MEGIPCASSAPAVQDEHLPDREGGHELELVEAGMIPDQE
jgi:hypothetical protein